MWMPKSSQIWVLSIIRTPQPPCFSGSNSPLFLKAMLLENTELRVVASPTQTSEAGDTSSFSNLLRGKNHQIPKGADCLIMENKQSMSKMLLPLSPFEKKTKLHIISQSMLHLLTLNNKKHLKNNILRLKTMTKGFKKVLFVTPGIFKYLDLLKNPPKHKK